MTYQPLEGIHKGEIDMVTLSVASLVGLLVVIPIGLSVFAYKFEGELAKEKGLNIPIIYNTSGYETKETIKMLKRSKILV